MMFTNKVTATPYDIGYPGDIDCDEEGAGEGDGMDEVDGGGWIPSVDSGPDLDTGARLVDYTDRGPSDAVLSGPVLGGWGPGRYHRSRRVAYTYLVDKHGEDRVRNMSQSKGRWSFLVKNLKAGASGLA